MGLECGGGNMPVRLGSTQVLVFCLDGIRSLSLVTCGAIVCADAKPRLMHGGSCRVVRQVDLLVYLLLDACVV